jgi:hypothetical protein
MHLFFSCGGLLDRGSQLIRVRAHDLGELLAVLEQLECGHGANAEFLGHVRDVVDVDFDEVGAGELFGESGGGVC